MRRLRLSSAGDDGAVTALLLLLLLDGVDVCGDGGTTNR
jgi:hypothetical protein